MTYRFAAFELDDQLYQLRSGTRVIKLEPKVFDVLRHLIRHRDRVISKEELLDALWPGEFVSESVLPRCVTAARKALGDTRQTPAYIATVHGRGYRFLAAVTEAADGSAAAPAVEAVAPPEVFVGREEALLTLRQGLADAVAGRGRLLLLVGEPGIGKTRTAEEIAAEASRAGAQVVSGRCYEGDGAPAFWPWVQVLRGCVQDGAANRLAADLGAAAPDLAELVPEIRQRLPQLPPATPTQSDQARFRLFDGITTFLARRSAAHTLIVILDDLHWADPSSLQLLQFLAREVRRHHLLIVGTYRDVELRRQHPLAHVLGELAREPSCERIVLRGLEEGDVRRLLEHATTAPVPDALVTAVYQMTEGNPFFIGQIVRWLATEGRLQAAASDPRSWSVILPQGVREAIGRRLNALSDQCNEMLGVAAVVGREVSLAILERLTDSTRDELLELLDEAESARIVHAASSGLATYTFAHALIRHTLYEELPAPRRVQLHRRVGEVLETLHRDDPDPPLAELAHHFYEAAAAGNVDIAIAYAVRAAQRAARVHAYEEAASYYDRALQLADLQPSAANDDGHAASIRRYELLLALGDAHGVTGNRDQSQRACRQAATVARRLERPDLLARAALGFGQRGELGPQPAEELRLMLEEALEALPIDAYALRARIMSRLVGTAPYQHSMATRAALSQQAVELATRSSDLEAQFDAQGARLWALMGPDDDDERLRVANDLALVIERSGQLDRMLQVHEHRMRSFLSQGDLAAADRENAAYVDLTAKVRQSSFLFYAGFYRVGRAIGDGRFAAAEREMDQLLTLGRQQQQQLLDSSILWQIYWMLHEQGRVGDLATTLVRMSQRWAGGDALHELIRFAELPVSLDSLASRHPFAPTFQQAAAAYWQLGSHESVEARELFAALAANDFTDIPRDEWWVVTLTLLAEICAMLGDARRARPLYDLLAPFGDKNAAHQLVRTYGGAMSHFLGILALTMGELETAARHFEHALAMNLQMGALPALARTRYELARLLMRRNRGSDRDRARSLLAEALQTATDLDLTGLVDKISRMSTSEQVTSRKQRK